MQHHNCDHSAVNPALHACRGAYDEAYVTALGPSTGCVNACKDYRGADRCGGEFAISLYRVTGVQYDTGAGEQQKLGKDCCFFWIRCLLGCAVVASHPAMAACAVCLGTAYHTPGSQQGQGMTLAQVPLLLQA